MFFKILEITGSSIKMCFQELWKNKLRTFLSLFGVTIGIFCIIGVLAVVGSLKQNIKNEIQSLGSNAIYLDKWEYAGNPDFPWWKYVNRPVPQYKEVAQIKSRTALTKSVTFCLQGKDNLAYAGLLLNSINIYSVSEDFISSQPMEFSAGRYLSDAEFNFGSASTVIGYDVATKLFQTPELAIGKAIEVRGKRVNIIGVITKRGQQMIGGWNFDQSIILPYHFGKTIFNERKTDPVIIIQGKDDISSEALINELEVAVRSIRKLNPRQESNFSLNDISNFLAEVDNIFVSLNLGAGVIGGISLIVGLFGVANIMFVTVKERTSQIGLKKALGAKSNIILLEFLLESAVLCIIGGIIGLIFVYTLAKILTNALNFPVYLSIENMVLTFIICLIVGVLAGIIPAVQAAKMDPVKAIRS